MRNPRIDPGQRGTGGGVAVPSGMAGKIAIVGWGSLLWDSEPQFDRQHRGWRHPGPKLKLEFSQIASPEDDGLALVIDPEHGKLCTVAYVLSRRACFEDAFFDLQAREKTTHLNIGFVRLDVGAERGRDIGSLKSIRAWARKSRLSAVLWTDTPSNFRTSRGKPFSVANALAYIRSVKPEVKSRIAEYVWRSPKFVDTPLRRKLESTPWFAR